MGCYFYPPPCFFIPVPQKLNFYFIWPKNWWLKAWFLVKMTLRKIWMSFYVSVLKHWNLQQSSIQRSALYKLSWSVCWDIFIPMSFNLAKIFFMVILRLFLKSLSIYFATWCGTLGLLQLLWFFFSLNFLEFFHNYLNCWNWHLKLIVYISIDSLYIVNNYRSSLFFLILNNHATDFVWEMTDYKC